MTAVKLCGMRTLDHARAAVDAGAEYIGFVLAPGYRRTVAPEAVREIITALEPSSARYVGVFVDSDPLEARDIARYAGLDVVQLSGRETPQVARAVGLPVIKVVHIDGTDPVAEVERYAEVGAMVSLDAGTTGAPGGTGEVFEWSLAVEAARRYPVMLAGGLTPANVAAAIREVAPEAVDVSSGIETEGVKDPVKIRAFVAAAREAGT